MMLICNLSRDITNKKKTEFKSVARNGSDFNKDLSNENQGDVFEEQ